MTVHEGRIPRDAKVGDIVVRASGVRRRIANVRRDGEGTYFVLHPIKPKPLVRTWLWALMSAVASAALTYWWLA
jgi:hypothetical protein